VRDEEGPQPTLLQPLAVPEQRAGAAGDLAARLGAGALLLYVKDPQLGVMLPASGMPKTVSGGPRWRAFLLRCALEERPEGTVDLAGDAPARAIVRNGAALIVVGGRCDEALLAQVEREFPLLAAVLVAQQALQIERAEAAGAREAAAQAHDLARALDKARAASAELNLQLRQEHERKDEFLAMLSHELRNPLAPLVHSIELLRTSGKGEAASGRQLEVMARQLQQLTRLVDDLLDVSRVSRGLIELRRERLALDEVLDDAIEVVRPLLEGRGHALSRTPARQVWLNGDRVRLTQVFANLLSNAAKYSEPGGRITLSVVEDQRRVSVVVQDAGIGIPQDMLTRVFDMFTQVAPAHARSVGGLGIGLTLVRRIVELHGGRVSAYSRGPGQGSTFTVSLPQLSGVAAGPPPAAPPATAGAPPASAHQDGKRPLVLVVDDNRDAAETVAALMERLGAKVRIAHEGAEALRVVADFGPDLILLDIGLPGMDGYEIVRRLRALPGLRARVVALTGYGAPQDRERALAAGFDDHVVKPLSLPAIQALLREGAAMQADS
jgi:signal transduction histidine kinase/ActR/RegA family two-component response regulator